MTFFIHHMNQQLLIGEAILSYTSLKPADLQSPLSARYVQEAYTQANAAFTSYLGWLTRKVRGLITDSSLDDDTKTLFYRFSRPEWSRSLGLVQKGGRSPHHLPAILYSTNPIGTPEPNIL